MDDIRMTGITFTLTHVRQVYAYSNARALGLRTLLRTCIGLRTLLRMWVGLTHTLTHACLSSYARMSMLLRTHVNSLTHVSVNTEIS